MPSIPLFGGSSSEGSSNPSSLEEAAYTEAPLEVDEKKIIDWVNKQQTIIKQDRNNLELQWQLNLSFYFGKQNVVPRAQTTARASGNGMLWEPPRPYYRVRTTINRIRPTVRQEMAKLTASKPNAYIIPATSEARDLSAAQAGEQVWDSFYRGKKIHEVLKKVIFWTLTTGNGFAKVVWDPDEVDVTSNQMGDIKICNVSPFHLLVPDLTVEELEEQPFVIHQYTENWESLKFKYPDLKPTRKNAQEPVLEPLHLNTFSTNQDRDKVLCFEAWVKPGKVRMFPDGAVITIVGDQLVQFEQGWPYDHGMFPFVRIGHIPGGKFYCDSSIVDLIHLQREYNRTRSQIIEAKNLMAKPQMMAYRGSVDPSKITTEPGQFWMVNPGFDMPQPVPLQPLPNYVVQELDRILMDWSDISGQHEVSKGQVPPGVTAATAISYLQEQDEAKLSHTVSAVETAVEQIAKMTLSYVVQYWETDRIVRPTGLDMSFDVLALKGSDLRGNTDIKVEAGSALPVSRAAKQAFIMDLMDRGYIPPSEGLEVMDMGGINTIYERLQVDKRQVQRENIIMSKVTPEILARHNMMEEQKIYQDTNLMPNVDGIPSDPSTGVPVQAQLIVPVNTWDNHGMHIELHNMYRKSQSFLNLNQDAKDLFEAHCQQHLEAMQLQMPQDPMAMGGMPPGPGNMIPEVAPKGNKPPSEGQPPAPPTSTEGQPEAPEGMKTEGTGLPPLA